MTKDAAMDALLQAAKADGKPSDIPGISFSEDTWLDLLKGSRQVILPCKNCMTGLHPAARAQK
jgi:hypothetical protein